MEYYRYWIGKRVKVKVDRPLGSSHPEYSGCIYWVNYGFVPDTLSEFDREEIDAYILGPNKPLEDFEGIVIAVVVRPTDEIKLVVTKGNNYSVKEIEDQINFQERYFEHTIIK